MRRSTPHTERIRVDGSRAYLKGRASCTRRNRSSSSWTGRVDSTGPLIAVAALTLLAGGQTTSIQSAWFDWSCKGEPFTKIVVIPSVGTTAASRVFEDIVFEPAPADGVVFRAATGLEANAIATAQAGVRRRLMRGFVRRGLLPRADAQAMAQWQHGGGFSVDGSVRIAAADRAGRERLLRDRARPDVRSDRAPQREHRPSGRAAA